MEDIITKDTEKITTIKLNKSTKERIDHLRMYARETYDEIAQRMLEILNLCRINPEAARRKLIDIDRAKRKNNKIKTQQIRKVKYGTN